uniref:Secreted protein n=1 Tax=Parascaris univalens TaxID=6257 RepID=A0A915A163_PARUN
MFVSVLLRCSKSSRLLRSFGSWNAVYCAQWRIVALKDSSCSYLRRHCLSNSNGFFIRFSEHDKQKLCLLFGDIFF